MQAKMSMKQLISGIQYLIQLVAHFSVFSNFYFMEVAWVIFSFNHDLYYFSNYAFLYGTIPTAPSVFVYATNYEIIPDLIANTITASTFIAAPLMFVTARMLTLMNMDPRNYIDQLDIFLLDISVVGLIAACWVCFVLIVSGMS